ncbi:MAG: hypothetical protein JWM31_981, partial [Solirubrobacterales bacterium]|nr:hypothetical protein [Solirubrobacterales bacterium]
DQGAAQTRADAAQSLVARRYTWAAQARLLLDLYETA